MKPKKAKKEDFGSIDCEGCPKCRRRSDYHRMSSQAQLDSYDAVFDLFAPDADCQYEIEPDGSFSFTFDAMGQACRLTNASVRADGEVRLYFGGKTDQVIQAAIATVFSNRTTNGDHI